MSSVQSIARAFAVLGVLADGPTGVTVVAERVGLPKSTVARLLAALAAAGAVEQVPGGTAYRLGAGIRTLAGGEAAGRDLVELAHPELEALVRATGEAAGLSLLDGATVRYVDQVETPNAVRVRDWTGTRIPLHAVPSGIVILASRPPAEIARYLAGPLERFTPRTLVDPDALRERLVDAARDGVAWGREEYAEGIVSVAAPVADARGELVAALHVHGPAYRFPVPGREEAIAAEVVAAAARVSERARGGRGTADRRRTPLP